MRYQAAASALLALACSDGPVPLEPGDAPGTFTATFSGAVVDTLTGDATFVVLTDARLGTTYSVQLYRGPGVSPFWLRAYGDGPRPGAGSYAVTPRTSPQSLPSVNAGKCLDKAVVCAIYEWGTRWETPAGAGRLELTKSTAAGVVGTLEVDLQTNEVPQLVGRVLHVSARFNAPCHPDVALC